MTLTVGPSLRGRGEKSLSKDMPLGLKILKGLNLHFVPYNYRKISFRGQLPPNLEIPLFLAHQGAVFFQPTISSIVLREME